MNFSDHNRENEDDKFDWKDILAMTIALYQLLLPRLLAILLGVGLVAFLLLRFWLR